ncbi:hypothetical protein F4821DRAFT_249839 [Hypoxylon rubiginosum]|uniref:Uncharacterized protein n=1 Tax=Hypoxylon rubiginosum TaxID=110542 RepID=A0ACC0CLD1_9PEZI|nr:hypothetical protein F4821DRAFT_249839 [Hypoxylon rubiginosum]
MASKSNNPTFIDISNLPATTPSGPSSPQHEKEAMRAMSRTDSWKPSLGRKQSYHMEDKKHALQMSGVQDLKESPGFTERK